MLTRYVWLLELNYKAYIMSSKLLLAVTPAACPGAAVIGTDRFDSDEGDGQGTTDGWELESRELPPDPVKLTDSDIAVRMDEKRKRGKIRRDRGWMMLPEPAGSI